MILIGWPERREMCKLPERFIPTTASSGIDPRSFVDSANGERASGDSFKIEGKAGEAPQEWRLSSPCVFLAFPIREIRELRRIERQQNENLTADCVGFTVVLFRAADCPKEEIFSSVRCSLIKSGSGGECECAQLTVRINFALSGCQLLFHEGVNWHARGS
jgi:hypothetical protein